MNFSKEVFMSFGTEDFNIRKYEPWNETSERLSLSYTYKVNKKELNIDIQLSKRYNKAFLLSVSSETEEPHIVEKIEQISKYIEDTCHSNTKFRLKLLLGEMIIEKEMSMVDLLKIRRKKRIKAIQYLFVYFALINIASFLHTYFPRIIITLILLLLLVSTIIILLTGFFVLRTNDSLKMIMMQKYTWLAIIGIFISYGTAILIKYT